MTLRERTPYSRGEEERTLWREKEERSPYSRGEEEKVHTRACGNLRDANAFAIRAPIFLSGSVGGWMGGRVGGSIDGWMHG